MHGKESARSVPQPESSFRRRKEGQAVVRWFASQKFEGSIFGIVHDSSIPCFNASGAVFTRAARSICEDQDWSSSFASPDLSWFRLAEVSEPPLECPFEFGAQVV